MSQEKIKLDSGRVLTLGLAPFADARKLYQIASKGMIDFELKASQELDYNFLKNVACFLVSNPEFEDALMECAKKCLYEGEKVTEDLFEDEKAREDYLEICFHIAKKNIGPFMKTLMQKYSTLLDQIVSTSQE